MHGLCSVRNNVLYFLARCEEWPSHVTGEQWFEGAKVGTGRQMAADVELCTEQDVQVALVCGALGA